MWTAGESRGSLRCGERPRRRARLRHLDLGLQPPELQGNKSLLFKPPSKIIHQEMRKNILEERNK